MQIWDLIKWSYHPVNTVGKDLTRVFRTGREGDNSGIKAHNKKYPAQPTEVEPDKGEKR